MKALFLLNALWLAAQAADLSGSWVARREGPGGRVTETQYDFKVDGATFSGVAYSSMGEQKIVNGAIDGDTISFEVEANFMGQTRRMKYQGKLAGDELKLTMQMPAGGPGMGGPGPGGPGGPGPGGPGMGGPRGPREITARRGASEALKKEREAEARRPKTPLPAVRTLATNGLAKTPPMGWNSWNKFAARISDALIREVADAMVSSGMLKAGYNTLVIDDGWQLGRDEQGVLRPNDRFPDMKALADYVHAKGLKFGIYSSPGPRTCQQLEGSAGYEARDAQMFAAWGVDYLKYDWCGANRIFTPDQQPAVYQLMAEQLRKTGRPIVYSISQYGTGNVGEWAPGCGANLWRTTFDIRDSYQSMAQIGFGQSGNERFAKPGHWNDPDMLEVGNGGLSGDESRTHMALWAILAAPLMAGNDVRQMSDETKAILLNPEVIAVNQDPLGRQGARLRAGGDVEVWTRPLAGGATAVGLFNKGAAAAKISFAWSELGLTKPPAVRDLWKLAPVAAPAAGLEETVAGHGVAFFKITPAR